MFKVKRESQGDDILLTSQGVFFTEVLGGLNFTKSSNHLSTVVWAYLRVDARYAIMVNIYMPLN